MTTIRIGTRGSALALWQARFVAASLRTRRPHAQIDLVEIASTGDRVADVPLANVEGTGFFTATLERALLDGRVDVAVHSYKDLPVAHTPGLLVAAVPSRGPIEDVLCARDGLTLETLPPGASIGTCSTRRTAQVRAIRTDLDIQPLRGNVPTRVGRVTAGELDAIVLARAGLARLGLEFHISQVFPASVVMPAPAQGALAVQCRADAEQLVPLLAALDDDATRRAVAAERTVLHALGGGCSVPVGAYATFANGEILLTAGVFALDQPRAVRTEVRGTDPDVVGRDAARRLIDAGAGEILGVRHHYAQIAAASATSAGTASNSPQWGLTPKESR
jgi:hydroxymethylbilane synthase